MASEDTSTHMPMYTHTYTHEKKIKMKTRQQSFCPAKQIKIHLVGPTHRRSKATQTITGKLNAFKPS